MPYIGNITQDFNVSNAMLDTDSVTSIKIVDGTIEGADIAANLDLSDSQKIRFGTGNDLQIYHNGTDSIIDFTENIHNLRIRGNNEIRLEAKFNELSVKAIKDGAVELYYDNSKKLETTSSGVSVSGQLDVSGNANFDGGAVAINAGSNVMDFADNFALRLGNSQDLAIFHDASNSIIRETGTGSLFIESNTNIFLGKEAGAETYIKAIPDGAVELYYDNDKVLNTIANGIQIDDATSIFENSTHNTAIIQHGDIHHAIILRGSTNAPGTAITNTNVTTFREYGNFVFRTGATNAQERLIIEGGGTSTFLKGVEGGTDETLAKFIPDGAVELYYDGSKKFETKSTGVGVTGNLEVGSGQITCGVHGTTGIQIINDGTFGTLHNVALTFRTHSTTRATIDTSGNFNIPNDSGKIRLGASEDMLIYHDGSHSYVVDNGTGELRLASNGGGVRITKGDSETLAFFDIDGVNELYYDNSKKFETDSNGVTVTGTLTTTSGINAGNNISMNDNVKLKAGTGDDLQIYHDGQDSIIDNSTNSLKIIAANDVEAIKVYNDGTVNIGNNADNIKLRFGIGSDLQIYHQGSHSYIQDAGTGSLILVGNQVVMQNAAQTENMFAAIENGANTLYYDNNVKLSTTSQGIEVTSNSTVVASVVKATGSARADMRILAEGSGEAYLWFDASNGDLSGADYAFIQHRNSDLDLIIANYANDVIIKNRNGSVGAGGLNTAIHCHENGAVDLYHDTTKCLETDMTPDTHSQTVNAGIDIGQCLKLHVVDGSNCAVINALDMHHCIVFRGETNDAGTTVTNGNAMTFREFGPMFFRTGGTNQSVRLTIGQNGSIGAPSGTNIYNASDSRLKKNVVTLDKGLEAIKALRPVAFNWIDGFCDEESDTLYGFVAQEVQTVDSNLVAPFGGDVKIGEDIENPTQTITDPLRVNEKYVIPMLVKAVQELEAKVAALEAA